MITKFPRTNLAGRATIIYLILLSLLPVTSFSQDLYSPEQSQKYAEFLFQSQQYSLAAEEYERLIYFDNNNVSFKYQLVRSYRLSGNLNSGIDRVYKFYGSSLYTMPQTLAGEFVKLQLLKDSLHVVNQFISSDKSLSLRDKIVFQSCDLLLNGKYKEAGLYVKSTPGNIVLPSNLLKLTEHAGKIKFKKSAIAAGLSAIVPGTGKFYSGNWTDGIISLLFVTSNAWQAYRGFSRDGIKSGYGWVFSGLSASFYIGNIFGSVKAVKRYNTLRKNEVENQIYEFVRSDTF